MLPRLPLRSQLPRRLSRALPRNLSRVVSRHLSTLIAGGAVFGGATLAFASQWPQGSEAEAASASASGFEPARRPPGKNDRSRFEGAASGAGAPSRSNPTAATNANANANASAEDAEGGEGDGEGTDNMNNNSAAAGRGGGSSFFNRMTGGYMDGAARTAASTARTAASTARSAAAKLVGRGGGGGGGGAHEEGGQHASVGSERLLGALSRTSEGVTTDGEKPLSPADQAKAVDPRLGER